MIGRSGKDEVCDLEGADGSVLGGGEGVELLGDTEGSFADFAGGADVAYYGGVDIGVVNYRTVVANSGREGLVLDADEGAWNDDVGVCGGDEEGVGAELLNLPMEFLDAIGELLALEGGGGEGEGGLEGEEAGFAGGEEGVGAGAALGPLVAGDGLESFGIGIDAGDAVAVGAVAIDIHIGLNPEDLVL